MLNRKAIFKVEGQFFPGKTYTEVVLEPAYEEAKHNLYESMMAINKAHLIMLVEQKLVSQQDANIIMKAINGLDEEEIRNSKYTGQYEDLFFQVEHLLLQSAGEIAGNLHLARSRNDMGVAMYRMALRKKLLSALSALLYLQESLLTVAEENVDTVMLGYTHTQQAQPTTLAHYLMAVVDSLGRDVKRLQAAYSTCNRSSLGAAALTTSGFAIDRKRVAELLAFEGLVENSYDAIGGGDYLGEIASSLQLSFLGMGRFLQDLLLWSTQEFGAVKVADPYVQISSIMPQKRNPVSFEHIRSLCSSGVGNTSTVLTMLHNTPFGDIVDTEDDMQPYLWKALRLADQLYRLLAVVMGTAEVNKDLLLERAKSSFATITELADTLVRECGLSFRTSHSVVSRTVKLAMAKGLAANQITTDIVDEAAQEVLGRPLQVSQDVISKALDPVHFVEIRSLPGGPAPVEMKRMIGDRQSLWRQNRNWLQQQQQKVEQCMKQLDETAKMWGEQA
ncbi:argininosuccinate lyase [Effusibacillus lacus]|uniref:Argininosuccinate lyase n=1 Tax=Effusibacillus lacus TaxID=1348429 RepID=A0A292YNG6_9BACL|nr:argininosuccinate lyase [Effusibacillus lacus]TCS71093.1 argininosuccinate lyase [Effusibacillus lacus]GAX90736.1 argininosuccinate lyase [Effusibacillus lacus]